MGLAGSVRAATTYVDTTCAFTVTLPKGWHAKNAQYSVHHYRDVFFCANNYASGIRVADVNGYPNDLARGLPLGTVYVDFAHFEGPGGSAMFGPGRDDCAEDSVRAFLRDPKPRRVANGVEWYELSFVKWGSSWSVWIFCRRPFDRADFKHALELVESLQFPELPIRSEPQAVRAAMEKLPNAARGYDPRAGQGECSPEDGWLARGGRYGLRETRVRREGNSFNVSFKLYTTGNSNDIAGEWHYTVLRNGMVLPKKP